jgi:hypothetical protein
MINPDYFTMSTEAVSITPRFMRGITFKTTTTG